MREITHRELRRNSSVMEDLAAGQSFIITQHGVPVGELRPLPRAVFADRDAVLAAFANVPPIDVQRFRRDVDRYVDQAVTERG